MLHAIAAALIGVVSFIGGLFVPHSPQLGTALPSGPAVFETSLQSRISSTDTSMTLVANSVRGGSTLTGYQCFTVDEGRTDAEYICGTISGTSVTGLARGIDPQTGTTTTAALKFAHRVGANVKITDFPLLQILRNQANGVETYPNLLQYANTVLIGGGSPSTTIATKFYVDSVAVAGASDATESVKGITELATAAEAAAGTSAGSTLARLSIPASICSSTSSTANLCVISNSSGKLTTQWINSTGHYIFGSLVADLASTTNATTTAFSITGSAFHINGLNYRWPATQGASSTVLATDGSSGLSWSTPAVRVLYNSSTVVSTTNSASTTILTISIPANTLGTTRSLEADFNFTNTGSSFPICNYSVYFGTGSASTSILALQANNAVSWAFANTHMFATSTASEFFRSIGATDTSTKGDGIGTANFGYATRFSSHSLTATTYIGIEAKNTSGSGICGLAGASVKVISQ